MKAIISGSTVFQEDYLQLQKDFKDKGVDVIDYPRFSQNLTAEYPQILTSFFKNIEAADIFFIQSR